MALQECVNGHIYDNDLHTNCPYCQGVNRIDFGVFTDVGKTVAATSATNYDVGKTVAATTSVNSDVGVTVAATSVPDSDIGVTVAATSDGTADVGVTVAATSDVVSDIGVTVAPATYKSEPENSDSGRTVGVYRKKSGFEPVVGWLVCIDGPQKGKDYRIYGRINSIGRDERMDICLRGDAAISRENHAKLAYDRKYNAFHIIPSEGANTIYLNGEPVYVPMKLKTDDIIEIGDFKLCFVPFCNENFAWDFDEKDGND